MEKNRIRPIATGKNMRMSYARRKEVLEMPNLIEIQKNSYKWFLDEGLKEVFDDISPISDYSGHLSLEFVDFELCEEDVKYSIEKCKERDATYAAPLKVKVRLYNKEKEEISEHEIFMGDLPLMTETGTFVINGAERVIVSQLVRSPGIYYGIGHDKIGKKLYSCTVIPNRGAWLEYETDSNDVFYVRVDRTRKVPITVLLRALGLGTNDEIREVFGDEPKIEASFAKDTSENYQEGLLELYKKIRPGEPLSVESAESLINAMFFDPRRYDLAKVGRYKFNKKLLLRNRIRGHELAEDVVDTTTGEILATAGTKVTAELADLIQNSAVPYVYIQTEERKVKVLSSMMVELTHYVDCDAKELGVTELVYYPVLAQILEEYSQDPEALAEAIRKNVHELIPKHITKEDILASINYNMHLEYGIGNEDDIDHLGNRRIRAVGELLQNQYRIGLSRLERDLIFFQNMFDLQLKIIRVIFFCGIRRFQPMGDGISSHIHAGKFAVSGESMLFGRIFCSINTIMVFEMTAYIRKKNRRMTFPVSRICLPDHFSVMYFIKNAAKLSTMIVYRYSKIVVFNCMDHK